MNCINPYRIFTNPLYGLDGHYMYVPCGRCPLCMSKKRNDWLFRLKQTLKYSTDAYFITLTYSPENLPAFGDNGLHQVQKFLKRFRKNHSLPKDFKYYLISELGGKFGRLHYHALFFNTGMKWQRFARELDSSWQLGRTQVKYVNRNNLHYVAKSHLQNVNKPRAYYKLNKKGIRIKVKPVNYFFMACSKGIGIEFLTASMIKYLRAIGTFTFKENGYEKSLPNYYLLKVYDEGEDLYLELKRTRLQKTFDDYDTEEQEMVDYLSGYSRYCNRGGEVPREPAFISERIGKAEQLMRRAKKYNFLEPPREMWFPDETWF